MTLREIANLFAQAINTNDPKIIDDFVLVFNNECKRQEEKRKERK